MILHFAVAVSIVLIGIKVLIGFGQTSAKTIGKGIDKIEQSYESYKWKKDEPKRLEASKKQFEWQVKKARLNLRSFAPTGCKYSAWKRNDPGARMKTPIYEIYKKKYIDYCLQVAYRLIMEYPENNVAIYSNMGWTDQKYFYTYIDWFAFHPTLDKFREEHKPDYIKEMLK